MNAEELRIGNLLETGNVPCYATISTIYHAEDFNPIPLTEEWLLKFGFIKTKQRATQRTFCYDLNNITFYYKEKRDRYYLFGMSRNIQLKYLHQLQNLHFALCGEELTVKEAVI